MAADTEMKLKAHAAARKHTTSKHGQLLGLCSYAIMADLPLCQHALQLVGKTEKSMLVSVMMGASVSTGSPSCEQGWSINAPHLEIAHSAEQCN